MRGIFAVAAIGAASAVSSDYVLVPGGRLMHKSCVHEVASGTHVGHADDGSLVFTPPGAAPVKADACAFPTGVTHGSAWKAWAQHVPSGSENTVTFLNGSWPVPPGPSDPSGAQTLFYWNGLEPTDTSAVLQPVLQWGPSAAGGGNYWAYASWYVSSQHGSAFSPLVRVSTGDVVYGFMNETKPGTWDVSCSLAKGTAKDSVLKYSPVTGGAPWGNAYGEVLEAYGVTSDCSYYPPTGSENVSGIALIYDAAAPLKRITWQPQTQTAGCGEHAASSPAGDVVSILFKTK